jgi:hypothetical protein
MLLDSNVVVHFEVTDTGGGIAKSEQTKVFLPYVRGGTTPTFVTWIFLTNFASFTVLNEAA